MDEPTYRQPPLDRLFQMGEPEWGVEWNGADPDYVRELGLTTEHVPALIALALRWEETDEAGEYPEEDSGWAPVHAWRALGQLRAVEAVEPLLALRNRMEDGGDDWCMHDLPVVFGLIGPPAIPTLAAFLRDTANPLYPRDTASGGLVNVGLRYPEARTECVKALAEQLARFEENEYELNGFLIGHLMRLKAVEAAEVIERAFAADRVDETICGDWGDVREELGVPGLGLAPDRPKRPQPTESRPFFGGPTYQDPASREQRKQREKKLKAKRKEQKKARKRNRR